VVRGLDANHERLAIDERAHPAEQRLDSCLDDVSCGQR
jgi:hypothetical protein